MNVFELMTKPVATCRVEDSTHRAAQLMWEHDCGVLPVTDAEGRLSGMITDRDICMSAYLHGTPLGSILVREAMAQHVFTCGPKDSIEAAEDLMMRHQIRRLPVVDEGHQPIGILSLNDIARHTTETSHGTDNGRALLRTLTAICQPRPRASTPTEPSESGTESASETWPEAVPI